MSSLRHGSGLEDGEGSGGSVDGPLGESAQKVLDPCDEGLYTDILVKLAETDLVVEFVDSHDMTQGSSLYGGDRVDCNSVN